MRRTNGREINAINPGTLNVEASTWQYDGEAVVIESAATQFQRYHIAYNGCDCKAGHTASLLAFRRVQAHSTGC